MLVSRLLHRPTILTLLCLLTLVLVSGCGGSTASAEKDASPPKEEKKSPPKEEKKSPPKEEKKSPPKEQKKESPKKTEQKKDNASAVLGKWRVVAEQCEGSVAYLSSDRNAIGEKRKDSKESAEFLEGGKLLLDNEPHTYTVLDSSRMEVSNGETNRLWAFSKPSTDTLRIEYEGTNGKKGTCTLQKS